MDVSIDFLLSETRLFKNLTPDEASIVCAKLKTTERPAGTVLCEEGGHAKGVWFVASGELEVLKKDASGNLARVTTLKAGQTVGEMGIVEGLVRSATIRTLRESTIVIMDREVFDELIQKHPSIAVKVLLEISRNLSSALRKTTSDIAALS
jgi:CRP-like cAMP-binding protein